MKPSRMKKTVVTAVAALSVAAGGTALAATSGSSTGPSAFVEAVATKLGISSDALKKATKAAATEQVDAQLKAGTITEAQADAMKERIAANDGLGFGGPDMGGHHGGPGGPGGGHLDDAATYLGLTAETLRTKLQAGDTLAEVAKAQGKTEAGLEAALIASEKKELAQRVTDGELTQAQADAILAGASDRFDEMIAGTMPDRGPGGPGGHGGRGFGPPPAGGPSSGSSSSSSTTTGASL